MIGPSAASPEVIWGQRSPATVRATGYLVVNQPTVRDRSMPGARSSSRPWPSTSMPMAASPSGAGGIRRHANAKAISRMSLMPAWKAAGTSPSSWRVVSASRVVDEMAGVGVGVELGLRRGQRRRGRGDVRRPGVGVLDDRRGSGRGRSAAMPSAGTTLPGAGSVMGCPSWCCAQAMLRSSNRIRQDTASTARWWTISTSWPVSVAHRALSIGAGGGVQP